MRRVFEDGECGAHLLKIGERDCKDNEELPPKELLISVPEKNVPASCPIVLLFHGFSLRNNFYSQLMHHIASHGFLVIAPQMYEFAGSNATPEITDGAAVINWIHKNSHKLTVQPDVNKLAVMGHSRGGKVAFGLALGLSEVTPRISALVGLDPVDGTSDAQQTEPHILKFENESLDVHCPALIVEGKLGAEKKNVFFPACAPEKVGPKAFFRDCSTPKFLFTATEHGHMDFLDDVTSGIRGKLTSVVCKNGIARMPMRRFTGGLVVAFLRAAFGVDGSEFKQLISDASVCPVRVNPPECCGEI